MLFSRFSSAGMSHCTKPAYLFSLLMLTLSLIFTSLLLAGCTSPSPILRNFHLLSLTYPEDLPKGTSLNLSSDAFGTNGTFSALRVGYRSICLETTPAPKNITDPKTNVTVTTPVDDKDASWSCYGSDEDDELDLAYDPLDLLKVARIFKDKISFSLPHFAAITFIGIAFLCVIPLCLPVPFLQIPTWTRKVAAASSLAAAVLSVGAMTLQQVTTGAVANLVSQVAMGNIEVSVGKSAVGFGWSAVAFVCVAAIIIGAVVGAEVAADRARERAEGAVNRGLGKATGGRFDVESGWKGTGTFGRTEEPMHPAYQMKDGSDGGFMGRVAGVAVPSAAKSALGSRLFNKH